MSRPAVSELLAAAWMAGELYEQTRDAEYLATERSIREHVARLHDAGGCDLCGYAPDECLCTGTAVGGDVVLLDSVEQGEVLS